MKMSFIYNYVYVLYVYIGKNFDEWVRLINGKYV